MQLFVQALTIMGVGMTLVFAFLAVVIGGMSLTARIIQRYESRRPAVGAPTLAVDPRPLAAAIAVAISEHHPTP